MLKLEMLRHTKWIELLNTAENSFCQFTKHFAGDLYHDFERAANIKPDTCPLDKVILLLLNTILNALFSYVF